MNRRGWRGTILLAAGCLASVALPGQDCTGILRGVTEMPDSVHVAWDPAAMPPTGSASSLSDAMSMWNGSCTPGNIPAFSGAASSVNVTVSYVSGNSFTDACGSFNTTTNRVTVYPICAG